MPIPGSILDREYRKFVKRNENDTAIAVSSSEFYFEIARGNVEGLSSRPLFGRNSEIDLNSAFETVWQEGGIYIFPSSAATVDVVSTNINDTALGTGAREIVIEYLDANYDTGFETIALNGTTPVTTTAQILRINNMVVTDAGSSNTSVGIIRASQGANVLARLNPVFNNTLQAVYTVPNGFSGYFTGVSSQLSIGNRAIGSKSGELVISESIEGDPATAAVIASLQTEGTGTFQLQLEVPLKFPEKSDIQAFFIPQQQNISVSVSTTVILEENP